MPSGTAGPPAASAGWKWPLLRPLLRIEVGLTAVRRGLNAEEVEPASTTSATALGLAKAVEVEEVKESEEIVVVHDYARSYLTVSISICQPLPPYNDMI